MHCQAAAAMGSAAAVAALGRDDDGDSPLIAAALNGHAEVARLLCLTGGARLVAAPGFDGLTPLAAARQGGHAQVERVLRAVLNHLEPRPLPATARGAAFTRGSATVG